MKKSTIFTVVFVVSFLISFSEMLTAQVTPPYYNNVGGGSSNSFPLNSTTSNKVQWIYGPGVFNTAGTTGNPAPAGIISTVYFMIGNITSTSATYNDFTIKLSQNVGTITA